MKTIIEWKNRPPEEFPDLAPMINPEEMSCDLVDAQNGVHMSIDLSKVVRIVFEP